MKWFQNIASRLMGMIKHRIFLINHYRKNSDPIEYCDVYIERGCPHVDGCFCDFPRCTILRKYRNNLIIMPIIDLVRN